MIAYCQADPKLNILGDVIVILSHTAMRIGELVAARWKDVDDAKEFWTIPDESHQGTKEQCKKAQKTKARRSRVVPIPPDVRDVLQRLEQAASSDGRIMHGPRGGILQADSLHVILKRDVLEPLNKRFPAKVDAKGLIDGGLHSFRHFFCSWAAHDGVPERVLMAWAGHGSTRMVRRYYHLDKEASKKFISAMSL